MSRVKALPVADFTGGLNLQRDPFQLAPNESPDLLNVEIDPRGGLRSREGWIRWDTTAISGTWDPKRLAEFRPEGGTRTLMLANNGKVMYSTSGTWATIQTSAVDIPATGPSGADFAAWGSTLYIACGRSNVTRMWTGSGAATALTASGPTWQDNYASPVGGYAPKADFMVTHAGYMFAASTVENGTTYRNRIRWSHPNSPENWATLDSIDVLEGGDGITALVPFGDHLLIFKQGSIWALYGSDASNWALVNVTREVGTERPSTVARSEGAVYFFTWPHGLFRYTASGIDDLSTRLRPAILDGDVNYAAIATGSVFVNFVNRRVWLSLPYGAGSPTAVTRTFVHDESLNGGAGAWVAHASADGYGVGPSCEHVSSTGVRQALACHPTLGYVLRLEVENAPKDAIATIDQTFVSSYSTGWLNPEIPTQKKMWRRPNLVALRGPLPYRLTVDVFANYDQRSPRRQFTVDIEATGGTTWGGSTWGGSIWGSPEDSNEIERGGSMGQAMAVQLRVSGTPGIPWAMNALVLKYIPRRFR